ncbi:hypothetical protein T310_0746 [Rasamsonia emersonii CBS 393.64]|uniref:Uncharacterized protein n=1 Tax=Rasamsonia emersonii (strain ATCC 16479 / CBS 393.64 / IMI 116815) TaxID=1408163 RepID=A0A0F4Z4H1_RASE3|nr:hypothetical protein T310_0746 [Rasamsonia emersonii CBS 393.64]KKA25220.1 hypothetical protein T310_0746 [Rasamsonia emersonii CBS 393.64]
MPNYRTLPWCLMPSPGSSYITIPVSVGYHVRTLLSEVAVQNRLVEYNSRLWDPSAVLRRGSRDTSAAGYYNSATVFWEFWKQAPTQQSWVGNSRKILP